MKELPDYACKNCGNTPDSEGVIEHGRGCYAVDVNGGGISFADIQKLPSASIEMKFYLRRSCPDGRVVEDTLEVTDSTRMEKVREWIEAMSSGCVLISVTLEVRS
jgi:hypothetical protein